MRILAAILMLTAAPLVATDPAQIAPPAEGRGWSLETIPWATSAPNGTRFALLEGVRDTQRTPFSYAFSIPAEVWDSPHAHSAVARVFVAKGTLRIGYGPSPEQTKAMSYPAGSYVIVPAGVVHYDGADEDTVIIGTAVGPWSTTYLDGSAPASAGTPLPH